MIPAAAERAGQRREPGAGRGCTASLGAVLRGEGGPGAVWCGWELGKGLGNLCRDKEGEGACFRAAGGG